jgi:hypothetical protein
MADNAFTEPYDPLPDVIARADKRPDGIDQLKDVARLALDWHRPTLTWVTCGMQKDPETGDDLWRAATVCACGAGEFPCPQRRQLTAILGVVEEYRP